MRMNGPMAAEKKTKWDDILDQRLAESDRDLSDSAISAGPMVQPEEQASLMDGTAAAVPPGVVARRAFDARRGKSVQGAREGAQRASINDLSDLEKSEVRRFLRRRLRNRRSLPFLAALVLLAVVLLVLMTIEYNRSAEISDVRSFSTPDAPPEPMRLDPPPPPRLDPRP
jgi:hypothetical protein